VRLHLFSLRQSLVLSIIVSQNLIL
jgi:hypothetical protein